MAKQKRLKAEDLDIPSTAHEVPKGYPVQIMPIREQDLMFTVYAPMMASPRPRVTLRGTFMPSDYRKHCDMMAASMAYARGIYESTFGPWDSSRLFRLNLNFWADKKRGDLDNLAKTIMDSGQLHRNEPPGAELWKNDSQICSLHIEWLTFADPAPWEMVDVHVFPTSR